MIQEPLERQLIRRFQVVGKVLREGSDSEERPNGQYSNEVIVELASIQDGRLTSRERPPFHVVTTPEAKPTLRLLITDPEVGARIELGQEVELSLGVPRR